MSKKHRRINHADHKKHALSLRRGWVCFYCDKPVWCACKRCGNAGRLQDDDQATLDHLIPYADGGPTILRNLVIACRACNERKDCLHALDYLVRLLTA